LWYLKKNVSSKDKIKIYEKVLKKVNDLKIQNTVLSISSMKNNTKMKSSDDRQ